MRKIPELFDVYHLLIHKTNSWNKIARELEVEFQFREEIERSIHLDCTQKLHSILQHWLDEGYNATWKSLIDALKELKYMVVVRTVQEFLAKPETVQKYINSGCFYI